MTRVLIVGELNPYGSRPEFALYHLPRNASGNKLRQIMGLSDSDYEALDKVNLCRGVWDLKKARETIELWKASQDDRFRRPKALILLGAKVRTAFKLKHVDFYDVSLSYSPPAIVLPHPSGRNLIWNDPFSFVRAREVLRKWVPEIPWGSCDD